MPDRAANVLAVAATVLFLAAVVAVLGLWPPTGGYVDADVALVTAKACAVAAGGTPLTAACVCAVGAVLARRP